MTLECCSLNWTCIHLDSILGLILSFFLFIARYPLVEVAEHHLLVLLQELPRELGEDLQEGHVGRHSGRVIGVLQRIYSDEDSANNTGKEGVTNITS